MPRRVRVDPFRHDRRSYARGQTAAIVASQVLSMTGDIHRHSLRQLLGEQRERQDQVVARWTNHRITEVLQLLAEGLEQESGQERRERLETLWQVCVAVLQNRA